MILSCKSCEKKFVVPDEAIGPSGRLVQCSACGNKWKQFPVIEKLKKEDKITKKEVIKKIKKLPKTVRKIPSTKRKRKRIATNLYSPEYLAKKHGIKLNEKPAFIETKSKERTSVKFGFYNYLIVFIIILTFLLRILYFTQSTVVRIYPKTGPYIDYLFENIRNIYEIITSFLILY